MKSITLIFALMFITPCFANGVESFLSQKSDTNVKFHIGDEVYVYDTCCIEKEIICDVLKSNKGVAYELKDRRGRKGLYYGYQLVMWTKNTTQNGCCE